MALLIISGNGEQKLQGWQIILKLYFKEFNFTARDINPLTKLTAK